MELLSQGVLFAFFFFDTFCQTAPMKFPPIQISHNNFFFLKKDNYKTRDTLERNLVTYILNKGLTALLHKVIIE